jgi:hypothetical protein
MPPYRVHADGRRLGKRPPKLDHRTLRLARYLTARLPLPPLAVDHSSRVLDWPMYANDELGICGPAGAAHQVQSWSTYAERGTITPPLQQVKDDYYAITGGADAGVYLLDMLNHWRRNGIGGDRIEAFVQVSPNLDEARLAVQLFGSLGMGLSLPDQGTFGPWDRLYGPPNPNNGHYVVGVRYADAERLLDVVTWGGILRMSYDFFLKYCDEAFAVLNDLSIVEITMRSPEGFDFATLRADLDHLGDPVTPDQPPVEGRGVIAGTVHTSEMQPIPGATVSTAPSGFATQADASGRYVLAVLPGAYAVSAVAGGYGPWTAEVVVAEGDTVLLDFQLGPAGKGCNLLRP